MEIKKAVCNHPEKFQEFIIGDKTIFCVGCGKTLREMTQKEIKQYNIAMDNYNCEVGICYV